MEGCDPEQAEMVMLMWSVESFSFARMESTLPSLFCVAVLKSECSFVIMEGPLLWHEISALCVRLLGCGRICCSGGFCDFSLVHTFSQPNNNNYDTRDQSETSGVGLTLTTT